MAKTRKTGKKNPAEVKVKLEEKQREAVRKEQKQVANSDKTNHALMVEQVLEWFKTHPRGFEHVYRSISLGSFDGLDGNYKEDGDEKLPSYMNKWRLLSTKISFEILDLVVPAVSAFVNKLIYKQGAKISKFEIAEIVAFVLRVDPGSALPSKQKSVLHEWVKSRCAEYESPLKLWTARSDPVCETWQDIAGLRMLCICSCY